MINYKTSIALFQTIGKMILLILMSVTHYSIYSNVEISLIVSPNSNYNRKPLNNRKSCYKIQQTIKKTKKTYNCLNKSMLKMKNRFCKASDLQINKPMRI